MNAFDQWRGWLAAGEARERDMTRGPGNHVPGCMCDAHVRQRTAQAARARVRAQIEAEQDRQRAILEGAMAMLEKLAEVNADGAPVQVNVPAIDGPPVKLTDSRAQGYIDLYHSFRCPQYVPPCTCRHSAWPPGEHGPACPQAIPEGLISAAGRPFNCPGCGFAFAARPPGKTSCQYCGTEIPAAVTVMTPAASPPLPDPVLELTAGIREPLGLDAAALDALASYSAVPPGTCAGCRQPSGNSRMCWYCWRLGELKTAAGLAACSQAPSLPARRRMHPDFTRRGYRVLAAALVFAAWIIVILLSTAVLG